MRWARRCSVKKRCTSEGNGTEFMGGIAAAVVKVTVKPGTDVCQRSWVGGDVPERVGKVAMAQITREQKQMMGDGRPGSAPLGNPSRGEGVAKIVNARVRPPAVADDAFGKPTKHLLDGVLGDGATVQADEEVIGDSKTAATCSQIPLQGRHG